MTALYLRRTCLGILVIAWLGLPRPALAQRVARSFDELQGRVLLGETVKVIDREGQTTRGELLRLTATDITLRTEAGEQTLDGGNVAEVKARRSGPLWNGAVIGAAVAVVPGIVALASDDVGCDSCALGFAMGAGIGAAIGVGIDALVKGDVTVMKLPSGSSGSALTLLPVIERGRRGVLCSIRF